MQSTRANNTPFSWKAEKYTSRSQSHSGVGVDSGLTYTSHVRKVAKDVAWKLSCIRRVAHLLDAQGVGTLYKSQVRSLMEYSPLAWSSCPPAIPRAPLPGSSQSPAGAPAESP
ncbi:hypothetical protein GWK47_008954 [Chionoecetes opilio]|uniref:Uncharacterized protein n=1 Tax=Chionoecetes opilio TaxID=41210 RepID=A0A8J5CNE5_CHIOP|nr:hypothetical protein GWK47_008954 [Chionoecetes opilio]